MQGCEGNEGIVPRAINELFALKNKMEKDNHYEIQFEIYMIEVYNERLYDSFSPKS
jgi:hypothetical protein